MSVQILTIAQKQVKASAENPSGKIVFIRLVEDENYTLADHQNVKSAYLSDGYQSVIVANAIRFIDNEPLIKSRIYIRQRQDALGLPLSLGRYLGSYTCPILKCDYERWEHLSSPDDVISDDTCIISYPKGLDTLPVAIAEATF